jgi:IS5 family transposase
MPLSDVRLAEALAGRASFRRFCGFARQEPTPERTTFVRFRAALLRRGLDRALFEAVTRQLDTRGVVVRTRHPGRRNAAAVGKPQMRR